MVEDFTFPTMTPVQCGAKKLPFPHFTSPPPWFIIPDDAGAHDHHRRCFSAAEDAGKANNDIYPGPRGRSERFAVIDEHKMDMLWEDFNEELARAPQPCPLSMEWSSEAWFTGEGDGIPSRHVVVASGTGSSVVRRRRLSLMMMLKLLKKLFLARKSSTISRKTPPN
ncbi:uncharacterized protein LOC123399875 [Hordeum vulgare subsp. vulgare]|uniref:Uncharacterized protein n=1 Tax=Hordeum vulgare subsp. vulgare TaxID=112509 RepID=A0A8I6YEQ7_HORVV|nr:uncharacterized protein LOC123399875 [Hordeum vulgare subsp. vulgare]KAI4965709.1 hypothetical protein ZWY2020_051085 [Hordeum vulgare]